jgi:hypothetical protein
MVEETPIQELFRRKLLSSVWMLMVKPTGLRNATLGFAESGLIENHPFPEEHSWSISTGRLEIFDEAGALTWYGVGRYLENGLLCIALRTKHDAAAEALLREAGTRQIAAPAPEIREPTQRSEMSETKAFEGHINLFLPPSKLIGWAVNLRDPENRKITVTIRLAGKIVGFGVADIHRQDLERFGSGTYAFDITCGEPLPFTAILTGQVVVDLSIGDLRIGTLQFDQVTKNIVSSLEIGRLLNELSVYDAPTLHNTLIHALPHMPEPAASALQSAVTIMKNREEIASFSKFEPGSMSSVTFKTGIVSSDCAAMLGQDGHLFLVEGTNNVREIFKKEYGQEDAERMAGAWAELILRRHAFVTVQGRSFIQIAIPEKISVMRELMDGHMSSPSATLSALEQKLGAAMDRKHYISGIAVLNQIPFGMAFRKADSHLTPAAAFAVFRRICDHLNINIVKNIPFDIPITVNGDLARRFFGHEMYEVCMTAKEPRFKAGLKLVSSHVPSYGGHVGKRFVFRNDLAPIRKKVILFGNSFFDNHVWQGSVSYWMAAWFQEYHFIFKPEMEEDYIAAENPDIVICQTIERFLELLPAT